MCVLKKHTICGSLVKLCLNTNAVHYCDIFSDIEQCFQPAQTQSPENQKFDHVRIILDNMR